MAARVGRRGPARCERPQAGVYSAKRTRGATGDLSSFYALRFHIVDQDKNNYLDRQEFAALGLPDADFTAVDANGDGQIEPRELTDFLQKAGTTSSTTGY